VSLDRAKPTSDTPIGTSVSASYGHGLNIDGDLDPCGGVVDRTITDTLAATHSWAGYADIPPTQRRLARPLESRAMAEIPDSAVSSKSLV